MKQSSKKLPLSNPKFATKGRKLDQLWQEAERSLDALHRHIETLTEAEYYALITLRPDR